MFRDGDEVEVWSKSKERWLRGKVTSIIKDVDGEGHKNPTAGSVKVKLLAHTDKWVDPTQFDQLRHYVLFERPADPEAPPCKFFCTLRKRYFPSDNSTGGEHQLRIGMIAVEKLWLESEQDNSQPESREVIQGHIRRSFQALKSYCRLGEDEVAGSVDLCHWLHQELMLLHPPGPSAAKTIANELALLGSKTLPRLVGRWMRMDKEGTGLVSKKDLAEAFRDEFRPRLSIRLAEKMAVLMLHEMTETGFGQASYSEFLLRCLGIDCSEVALYYYDLSNDWIKYASPMLLGSSETGVWHTGLAAFGREYFYGGRIFYGPPAATIWGKPTRAVKLGLTTRSLDDLRAYIFEDLDRKYDRKGYDVLDRNCNHFADEAARFLLGRGIPDEVRLQAQRLYNAPMARLVRPILNRWLGRVEGGTNDVEKKSSFAEKIESEQRKRGSQGGA
jgi:hypothetical protein